MADRSSSRSHAPLPVVSESLLMPFANRQVTEGELFIPFSVLPAKGQVEPGLSNPRWKTQH